MINLLLEKSHKHPFDIDSIRGPLQRYVKISDLTPFNLTKLYKAGEGMEPDFYDIDTGSVGMENETEALLGDTGSAKDIQRLSAPFEPLSEVHSHDLPISHAIPRSSPSPILPIQVDPVADIPRAIFSLVRKIKAIDTNSDGFPMRKTLQEQFPQHFTGSRRILTHKSPLFA